MQMRTGLLSLVFTLSFVLFAVAAPSPVKEEQQTTDLLEKRQLGQLGDILSLLGGLSSTLGPLLSLLGGLTGGLGGGSTGGGSASPVAIISQITQLIGSLTGSLKGIVPLAAGAAPADGTQQVAQAAGDIVNSIGKAISTLPTSLLTLLAVVNLDINVTLFLTQLNVVISGILVIIAPIVSILTTLPGGGAGLSNVLGLLGLL